MRIVNFTDFRNNLKTEFEQIAQNSEYSVVTTKHQNYVVLTQEEFESWQETLYLMSTEVNRTHLKTSQAEFEQGLASEYDFDV